MKNVLETFWLPTYLTRNASIWWDLINHENINELQDKEYEKVFLDR